MRNLILTLIIWIICFTAITIGVSLTYKWYRHLGKDIYINFEDVSGLVPNQSKVMYLGVQIGTITAIDLNSETGLPRVRARISRDNVKLLGKDSKFWIVSPEFSLGKIDNLSTISTGDYIAVFPVPGEFIDTFNGVDEAPVDNEFDSGLHLILKSSSAAGIDIGTGIMYLDMIIGEVGEMSLSPDGKHVLLDVYIDKKYSNVIRKGSFFGNVSGFHADISIFGGSKITLESVRTLIKGGINVVTPNLKAPPAENKDVFKLYTRDEFVALEDKNSC